MKKLRTRAVYRMIKEDRLISLSKVFPNGHALAITVYFDLIPELTPVMWTVGLDRLDQGTHRIMVKQDLLCPRDLFVDLERAVRNANLQLTKKGEIGKTKREIRRIKEVVLQILQS